MHCWSCKWGFDPASPFFQDTVKEKQSRDKPAEQPRPNAWEIKEEQRWLLLSTVPTPTHFFMSTDYYFGEVLSPPREAIESPLVCPLLLCLPSPLAFSVVPFFCYWFILLPFFLKMRQKQLLQVRLFLYSSCWTATRWWLVGAMCSLWPYGNGVCHYAFIMFFILSAHFFNLQNGQQYQHVLDLYALLTGLILKICVMFVYRLLLWIDLIKGLYLRKVLICAFAYDRVCLSWSEPVRFTGR